ncbi:hypothetical protein ACH4RG_23340 [Streptomyces sp. NPDC021019]|uniref:hypothetical protein n=1 Tax=Streptomyces sp. NPDC021019 TaxID=3365108 RepID=UPI0037A62BA8
MTTDDVTQPELTKWPRLLVAGSPVTPEQADEILVRTANLYLLDGNDKEWTHLVYRALGLAPGRYANATTESIQAVTEELDVLPLTWLYTSRIASSWIGGPHGWCDWDGCIGASTYNIGKWPEHESVLADWSTIAEAFPFLDLTAQLLADEGEGATVAQWRVREGRATEEQPGDLVATTEQLSPGAFLSRFFMPGGERGVTEERLTAAIERVRKARADLARTV